MANKTPNFALSKPTAEEFYDIEVQNSNMDKIDAQMKEQETAQENHERNHQNPHGITPEQIHAIPESKIGKPNGIASLDSNGFISEKQIFHHKIYGVKIQKANSNPESSVSYVADAVGMMPGVRNWRNTPIFKDIKPCVVKNGVVQYYLNPADLTQKADGGVATLNDKNHGDVMIEIPKLGYKIVTDESYHYVYVTDDPNAPGFCYRAHSKDNEGDCDKIYIGAFLSSKDGNTLYSLSEKDPATNVSLTDARTYAQSKGNGYELLSFYPITLIQCLFLIRYKSLNSQAALGLGYVPVTSRSHTGGTIHKGEDFGESSGSQQMCFLNIEDLWGNLRQWIDGLFSDDHWFIRTTFKNFNDTGLEYPFVVSSGVSKNLSAWISDIQGSNDGGFIIKEGNGSGSTYYSDYAELSQNCCGYFGGHWRNDDGSAGVFLLYINNTASAANDYLGARLVFKHKDTASS